MNSLLNKSPVARIAATRGSTAVESFPPTRSFDAAARRLYTIGDPVRLRILWWLSRGERSVTDLSSLLAKRQQAVTHHLNIMKLTRLIACRREGRFHYYRLTETGQEALSAAEPLIRS